MAYNDLFQQVGFGMDFSKDPFTQKVAGSGGLQPVLEHVFVGMSKLVTNPYAKVSCMRYIISIRKSILVEYI